MRKPSPSSAMVLVVAGALVSSETLAQEACALIAWQLVDGPIPVPTGGHAALAVLGLLLLAAGIHFIWKRKSAGIRTLAMLAVASGAYLSIQNSPHLVEAVRAATSIFLDVSPKALVDGDNEVENVQPGLVRITSMTNGSGIIDQGLAQEPSCQVGTLLDPGETCNVFVNCEVPPPTTTTTTSVEVRVFSAEGVAERMLPGDDQKWKQLEEGEVLPEGTEVYAGFDGLVTLGVFKDGELVMEFEMAPLTTITVNRHLGETFKTDIDIDIDFGEIKLDVKKETLEADAKISAPNHVTGIRGTILSVATNGLLDQVTLFEGVIQTTLLKSGDVHDYAIAEGERPLRVTTDGTSILAECRVGKVGCDPLQFPSSGVKGL